MLAAIVLMFIFTTVQFACNWYFFLSSIDQQRQLLLTGVWNSPPASTRVDILQTSALGIVVRRALHACFRF
jgi:hypothetical protein